MHKDDCALPSICASDLGGSQDALNPLCISKCNDAWWLLSLLNASITVISCHMHLWNKMACSSCTVQGLISTWTLQKLLFFYSVNSLNGCLDPGHVSSVAITMTMESWNFTSISLKWHFATTGSQSLKGLLISAHMIWRCRGMDSLHSCWNCHHYSNQIHYHGNTGHPLLLCKTSCGVTLLCKLIWVTRHPYKLMSFSLYSIRITSQLRECTIDKYWIKISTFWIKLIFQLGRSRVSSD